MAKYRATYDKQGKATEWFDGELVWVRPDLDKPEQSRGQSAAVLGDIAPFRSTIDGSIIGSRRDLRDHCARHNVVLSADLAGLPPKPAVTPYKLSDREREATKRTMHQIADQRRYFK